VSGQATLTSLQPDHLTLSVAAPGQITVRVRYTKFWSVASGQACVGPGEAASVGQRKSGLTSVSSSSSLWTSVQALTPGTVQLSASVLRQSPLPACLSLAQVHQRSTSLPASG
jgi:hypothetical protein